MLKIGIIGAGKWGKNHIRTFLQLPVEVIGIADSDPARQDVADEFGVRFFSDARELFSQVDAVSVVVPTNHHYEIVRNALDAGLHVFVEKPVTDDADKTQSLVRFAREKKLILSVGYLYRFNPAVQKVKQLLGDAGALQYISARYIHSTNPPRKDSGAVLNLGIHMVDVLNFILMERPKRVSCKRTNLIHPMREDSAAITLDYGNFFSAIEVSSCHPEKKRDMWIIAEKEKIYADFLAQEVVRYPIHVSEDGVLRETPITEAIERREPLFDQLNYFVHLVEQRDRDGLREMNNLGEEEYYTTLICERALKSAEFRRDLDIV
jgi:UDP-N-acetylglucosamine 3-dehydrogenase